MNPIFTTLGFSPTQPSVCPLLRYVASTYRPANTPTKKQPPTSVTDRPDPAPSAASLADSSYQYPDPSPANSPSSSSVMLNSTATVMSEAVLNTAVRDGAAAAAGGGQSMGNGGTAAARGGAGKPQSVAVGAGGAAGEATSRSAAGVQTTPSVNGTAEINRMK